MGSDPKDQGFQVPINRAHDGQQSQATSRVGAANARMEDHAGPA